MVSYLATQPNQISTVAVERDVLVQVGLVPDVARVNVAVEHHAADVPGNSVA